MGEIMTFEPTEAQFGVFWKYLQRPNVTDGLQRKRIVDYGLKDRKVSCKRASVRCIYQHFYAQYFQLRESSVQ